MELRHNLDRQGEHGQRAELREHVLQYGRLLGWPSRTAIAFTERASRRPWKRCTSDQLSTVVGDLQTIHRALATRGRAAAGPVGTRTDRGENDVDRS